MNNYKDFLTSKEIVDYDSGFRVSKNKLNPMLFDFQKSIVQWCLKRGRSAIFAGCGLGKTPMQLEWAKHVNTKTKKPVLILAPLAVSKQTKREGEKFGINVNVCKSKANVINGINITNYEKLHNFDASVFSGIVLDESSILKNFTGKIKKEIIKQFKNTKYKLACTATPSPNDHMELGNHSEFLDIMPSNQMLSNWFILDTMLLGKYRLKKHAVNYFWQWVASWACCLELPSDLGFDDGGFILPDVKYKKHVVKSPYQEPIQGQLMYVPKLSATNIHKELRNSNENRVNKALEIVNEDPDKSWIIWCNTNYESNLLRKTFPPNWIEVKGSDSDKSKEENLLKFTFEDDQKIITKPSIAGFGLNWQHCYNVIFVGLSYSYEMFYQAVRRSWRFGQEHNVNVHLIQSENDKNISDTLTRKQISHNTMQNAMKDVNFMSVTGKESKIKVYQIGKKTTKLPEFT